VGDGSDMTRARFVYGGTARFFTSFRIREVAPLFCRRGLSDLLLVFALVHLSFLLHYCPYTSPSYCLYTY
jgi:hypothetical protein